MTDRATDRRAASPWRRVALGTLAVTALWVALAAWQPATTYHLAPAVLAWAPAYLCATAGGSRRDTVLAALAGGVLAALVSVVLAAVGWLEGPALVGGGPLAESLLVAAAAVAIGVTAAGLLAAPSRRSQPDRS